MISGNKNNKGLLKIQDGKMKRMKDFLLKYFSFRSKFAQRIYIFTLTLGLVIAILSYNYSPDIGIELGKPSPRTIKAARGIEFEDTVKTEEDMNKNEAGIEDIYVYNLDVLNGEEGALYRIRYFYLLTGIIQKKEDISFEEKAEYMNNLLGNQYSNSIISLALGLSTEDSINLW